MSKKKLTTKDIEKLYDEIPRISQERSDFLLPQIVDFVTTKDWINIRPEYQRRLVWDKKKKSRLIESLLMNVPVPPVFLFEHELNRYEVMDGQQRINAITEFYNNEFKLTGLTNWSALNGYTYSKCPETIKRGLDRRRVSATVLLMESSGGDPRQVDRIRREVFERLNTGGLVLQAQELRNSAYAGPFNDLIIELAGNPKFNDLWGIPRYEDHYDNLTGEIDEILRTNSLFKRMRDCQLVLRFFALRERSNVSGAVKKMLDRIMDKYIDAKPSRIEELRQSFLETIDLAYSVLGKRAFQVKKKGKWSYSEPLYDGVMVSLDRLKDERPALIKNKKKIVKAIELILEDDEVYEVVVGRPNTAAAVKDRLDYLYETIKSCIK
jgi:hypothetical protein